MKDYRILLAAMAIAAAAVSCAPKAQIKGTLTGASDAEVIVKELDGSTITVLDTVKTNANGDYTYNVKVEEGKPLFVYVYNGDTKVASLILGKGDQVRVVSDTLGGYTVEGSAESELLQQVENDFSQFMGKISQAASRGDNAAISRAYIDYYRSRVKYVMENSKSLSTIPVLYQKINDELPVFSQSTDALHFSNAYDSLMTVYPESEYVKALGREAERRRNLMSLDVQIQNAAEQAYPDIALPGFDGTTRKLSEVEGKVVMLYFWQASDATQKMFNQDVLLPVYNDYHSKGFEIYSVSLDTDKGVWASAVRSQKLPWINVCDGLGAQSPAAAAFNVYRGLPVAFLIIDGEMSDISVQGENDLRKALSDNL